MMVLEVVAKPMALGGLYMAIASPRNAMECASATIARFLFVMTK